MELDEYVEKAARREERRRKKAGLDSAPAGEMLKPASETTAIEPAIEAAIEPASDPIPAFEESVSPTADALQPADAVFGASTVEPTDTAEEELRPEDVFKS